MFSYANMLHRTRGMKINVCMYVCMYCLINITKVSSVSIPSIKQLPFDGGVIRNSDFCVVSLEHKLYHKHWQLHSHSNPSVTQSITRTTLDNEILPVSKCVQYVTRQVLSPRLIFVSM
jgi:hypothetical protein